jgi:hypothetical protein
MARLYAFTEVYNTPQLREDVMTVFVEALRLNSAKVLPMDFLNASEELYDFLSKTDAADCKRRQRLDVAFHAGLLRACMGEMDVAEDDTVIATSKIETDVIPTACHASGPSGNLEDKTLVGGGESNL